MIKKKILSMILVCSMIFTLLPSVSKAKETTAIRYVGELPSEVEGASEAAETFAHAAVTICEALEAEGKVSQIIMGAGGATMAVAGVTAILKMCGLVEDPTEKKLAEILDGIHDIQQELQLMDQKLNDIAQQIQNLQVSEDEKDRASKVRDYLDSWNTFKGTYITKLTEKTAEYKSKIELATKTWWGQDKHDPVMLLYRNGESAPEQVVCNSTELTIPETSDDGSTVAKEYSFIVPSEIMPATKSTAFNVNTYKETFKSLASAAILKAANEKKLIAADEFYKYWSGLNDGDKKAKADSYGEDLLTAAVYNISCKQMTEDHVWVSQVIDNFNNYAAELVSNSNGMIQLINAQKNLNAFEGEAKDAIAYIVNSSILSAGVYGQMALGAASQDDMVSLADRQALQKLWINTINTLSSIGGRVLTGHDNFCYITGGLVSYKTAKVKSELRFWWYEKDSRSKAYKDRWWNAWYAEDSSGNGINLASTPIVSDVPSRVIYDNYIVKKATASEDSSYKDYMNKFGVGFADDFDGKQMTSYHGQEGFNLSDGLTLTDMTVIGDHYTTGTDYKLKGDSGNFPLLDSVKYNYLDASSGAVAMDKRLCSRAIFEEDHWYWYVDEIHMFYKDCSYEKTYDGRKGSVRGYPQYEKIFVLTAPVNYLVSEAPSNAMVGLVPGGDHENHIVKITINDKNKAVLRQTKLPYTGKAQKPVVKTIGGAAVKEGLDYTIKVNKTAKKIGSYTATITGTGHYVGTQKLNFSIVKADNPLMFIGLDTDVKAKTLKKKAVSVKKSGIIYMKKKGKGTITYKLSKVSASKYKKYFSINKKTGKLTIKKGLKKGRYGLFITVKAAGNKTTKPISKRTEILVTVA